MKLIVADDDPMIRMIVTAGMKALGHTVTAYENGAQAWTAYTQSPCQVMITDWSMPEMDGIELTQRVRQLPRDEYTYVIMLTGKNKREDYLTGIKAGVDAFLVKPLDGALLEAQVTIASRIVGLQEHTKRLEAIMTVCSYCKRVHTHEEWIGMEQYVAKEFKTLPSHTYCPQCFAEKVEPEMKKLGLSTAGLSNR
jgi:DNA-binding response OmpR family regulator